MYTPYFKWILINNMDHMRISGTWALISDPEPNDNAVCKSPKSDVPKVLKQVASWREELLNPQELQISTWHC